MSVLSNLSPAMGARNQVGIGLSYRPASLCSLATKFQTRFLESIPRPMAGLKFSTLISSLSCPCLGMHWISELAFPFKAYHAFPGVPTPPVLSCPTIPCPFSSVLPFLAFRAPSMLAFLPSPALPNSSHSALHAMPFPTFLLFLPCSACQSQPCPI
jgi:hypothetical protein